MQEEPKSHFYGDKTEHPLVTSLEPLTEPASEEEETSEIFSETTTAGQLLSNEITSTQILPDTEVTEKKNKIKAGSKARENMKGSSSWIVAMVAILSKFASFLSSSIVIIRLFKTSFFISACKKLQ